jgi:Zn ribbon nucleic-acid-binding protein
MSDRPICKSADHLFVPIIEVSIPLLRCIHCNVFAYQDTVKQLAKNRRYQSDVVEPQPAKPAVSYWRRFWTSLRRNLGFT